MQRTKIKVTGINKTGFIDVIRSQIYFDYVKNGEDFSVLIKEERNHLTRFKSYRTTVLTIRQTDSVLFVEILVPGKQGWLAKIFGKYTTDCLYAIKNVLEYQHDRYGFEYEFLNELEEIGLAKKKF